MERYRGLTKIKSYEEYKNAKERLKKYIEEYNWISTSESPMQDIKDQIDSLQENGVSEEQEGIASIQNLYTKFSSLKNVDYKSDLYKNIVALITEIEQYEARISNNSFFKTLLGAVLGKKEDIENLRKRYVFGMATITGDVPGEASLQLESIDSILASLKDSKYDWINIDPFSQKEQETTALTVVKENDVGNVPRYIKSVHARADEVIKEQREEGVSAIGHAKQVKVDKPNNVPMQNKQQERKNPKSRANSLEINEQTGNKYDMDHD